MVNLATLSSERDDGTSHIDSNHSGVELDVGLATFVESLQESGVATSKRDDVVFTVIVFLAVGPGRHFVKFDPFDVSFEIELPVDNVLSLLVFLTKISLKVVTDSLSERHVLRTIVALLVSSIDGFIEEFLSVVDALATVHDSLILVVIEFTVDQSLHGLTVFLLHELGNGIVLFGAVDESGADINLNTCELVGVDATSQAVSAFENDMGASTLSECSGGADTGHASSDDNQFMNLLHISFL